jgi:two-component system, NtrC family, sensor kinase
MIKSEIAGLPPIAFFAYGNDIQRKVVDKIAQPFFTTNPSGQGTCVDLSMSYDIVKAYRDEIKVETNKCEGSEFIIQLPIS